MRHPPVRLRASTASKQIQVTIHLRRRPGHEPIPPHEAFIGCPPRERLSNDEFARRFGAHEGDIHAVSSFCQSQGLTVLDTHAARRHVRVEGTVEQFNRIFNVEIHDYQKRDDFYHMADRPATLPDHLSDVIIHVGLGQHPKDRATTTGVPASTPGVNGVPGITPAQYMTLMGWPTGGAAGQTIAVLIFAAPLVYSLSDVQSTWALWGIPASTIQTISIDGVTLDNSNTFQGEWNMDICMASGFGAGANIVLYVGGNVFDAYSRILFPNPGDPVCTVTTESGLDYNEADVYVTSPSQGVAYTQIFEDAAILNVTICLPTGDFGSGNDQGDGRNYCGACVYPHILAVGGTTVGNISGNTFVEWLASIKDTTEAVYNQGGGGGVSIYVPVPSYQANSNIPNNTNTLVPGRGIPDVSSCFVGSFLQTVNGSPGLTTGGTSQSCPMTAGLIASINKAIGRDVGFINPTLYSNPTAFTRDINPGNSAGGPQNNNNGFFIVNNVPQNNPTPGYDLTNGWDPCVGLGVIKGNALVTYLLSTAETPSVINIVLSSSTIVSGQPSGTFVGLISVEMAFGQTFAGTLSLSGTYAPYLAITSTLIGNSLVTGSEFVASVYGFNIVATQAGAAFSPLTVPFVLTVVDQILGVSLAANPIFGGAASGTVVGPIAVQLAGDLETFSGTLSLSGTDAASFQISGSNLVTQGVLAARSYNINIVATQAGAIGSPFTLATTITLGTQSSNTFSGSLSLQGTDAAKFQIVGTNPNTSLTTKIALPLGVYNVNIVATQSGATGSPFTQAEVVTAQSTITGMTLSNNTVLVGATGNIGTLACQMTNGASFSGIFALSGTNASLFAISGSQLNLANAAVQGSYPITITATTQQAGVTNPSISITPTITVNPVTQSITITGVTLNPASVNVTGRQLQGTKLSAITVATNATPNQIQLTLTGAPASIGISGNNVVAVNNVPVGSYNFSVVAAPAPGLSGTPASQTLPVAIAAPVTVTGLVPFATTASAMLPSTCTLVIGITASTSAQYKAVSDYWATAGSILCNHWEIGNEVSGVPSTLGAYAGMFSTGSAGLIQSSANSQVSGPVWAGFDGAALGAGVSQGAIATLINVNSAASLQYLNYHQYLYCQGQTFTPTDDQVCLAINPNVLNASLSTSIPANINQFPVMTQQMQAITAGTYASNYPVLLGEYNVECSASFNDLRAGTSIGVAFMISALLGFASTSTQPAWAAVWDITEDAGAAYNLIDSSFNLLPEYYVLQQLIAHMPGTMVNSGVVGNSGVGTYATPGSGSITSGGHTYSIASNQDMLEDGNPIVGGSGTGAIDLYNNTVYAQDSTTGNWFTWNGSTFNGPVAAPGNLPSGPTGLQAWATKNGTNFAVAIVNSTGSVQSGQVALSHWPLNTTGTATVHLWTYPTTSNSGPVLNTPGTTTTINVTVGMTPSISIPAHSAVILYSP